MTARRYAFGLLPLVAAMLALIFFVIQEKSPVEAQEAPYLTSWEVLDEYGSLRIRPDFIASHPTQAQIVFVAPGIRKVKIKPHWEGSGITVNVATYDMSRKETIASDTITTSGTASSFLGIAPGGGTKLNISVTKGSQTTVYTKKALVRENSAANADNYLNSMGISPNPNARNSAPSRGVGYSGHLDAFRHGLSAYDSQTAGGNQQAGGSIALTAAFAPEVQEYSANAPFTPAGGGVQAGGSITLTPPFNPEVQEYSANVPHEVSSVIVSPVPSHSKATATVNGNSPSTPVSLKVGENVITVVVTAESGVQRTYTLTITRGTENRPPSVASAIADATIVNESGTRQVSLSGTFSDADNDSLTITARSSDNAVATASVAADYSTLTVTANSRGTATITVTASDGNGGTVSDSFTVTVKAAPVVASPLADVTDLEEGSTEDVSLSGVFSDADGDALTIIAASSDDAKATVTVAADQSKLTVAGVAEGTVSITVTAQDSDDNRVSDTFDMAVTQAPQPQKQAQPPGPVVSLELAAMEDSVTVSWQAPESGGAPDRYIVHLKAKDGGKGETKRPGAKKTAVTFRNLDSGTTYKVWVRAQNEDGKGERTHASITLPVETPGPVASLQLSATTDSVTASWQAPETGSAPDGYIVHLRPEGGKQGSGTTKKPKAKNTQVTFGNLEAGRVYKVWVRAQNEAGKGERVHASIGLPEAEPPPEEGDSEQSG